MPTSALPPAKPDFPIHGFVAPGFENVRAAFIANFTDGIEVGASLSVRHNGQELVNLWGGFQDSGFTRPWQQDTLVNVYSTTKGVAAIAFATLVEDGLLNYDDPVSNLWPEFRAAADGLTIGQLLSHQSGVPGVAERLTVTDLYDWSKMIGLLEQQQPYWPPGSAAGYHAIHWGFLVGELVRRAAGKSLGAVLAERIAGPLTAEFHLGLAASEHERVADLIGPNHARTTDKLPPPDTTPPRLPKLFPVALLNPSIRPWKDACSAEWRSAEIAAANGQASGDGIARIYDAAANGGAIAGTADADGVRVLEPATLTAANVQEVSMEEDLILAKPMRRSRGFILNTNNEYGPTEGAFGHAGAGGSLGFADPDYGIGFGYAMNQMQPGVVEKTRSDLLVEAVYAALDA